ncbi:MAG: ATPase, T2SS/T4P/T4SS family [Oscillospiraceae bacterium]|nr:ATPase, T2SS/T4P/T4SS family [Oscillospiraceae bacterium]MDD4414679.1 ATPase, T2SS/T4P/T4SS family [Oscillospiraceae bacterium]
MVTGNAPLGELLVGINIITQEQLKEALKVQAESPGKPMGDLLLSLGYITEKQLMQALEYRYRIPLYDLSSYDLDPEMAKYISAETAKKYNIAVIARQGNQLTLATSDPMNFHAVDDVKLESKLDVKTILATPSDIKGAIVRLYEMTQTTEVVDDINKEYTIDDVELLSKEINENVDNAPVVRLVNLIINHAIGSRSSDIHIEPLEKTVRVRFRIDGELFEQLTIPKSAHAAVVTRLKIMGDMNIAEKRIPQDGRIQTTFNGTSVDLRVSVLPTVNGEKIVIRILGGRGVALDRKKLGFSQKNSAMFDEILKNPNGIILVSGPTGSGKSTTLYTALNELNKPTINIITVEDPVEYYMAGINQVQVNNKAGLSFANGLRSILRQDPDIIMIGEIRDGETAEIAVRASITGHLVLSTIHTNDSASTVSRLVDMGIEPFLVAASLVGVISQRLVRRICEKCKTGRDADPVEMKLMNVDEPCNIYEGKGCEHCNNTGYKGRIAIHEVLVMTKELRELVDKKASTEELRQAAIKGGTLTLRESCTQLVLNGTTTIDELIKVTYTSD